MITDRRYSMPSEICAPITGINFPIFHKITGTICVDKKNIYTATKAAYDRINLFLS